MSFQHAKGHVMHALENRQYSPQYFAAYNGNETRMAQESWSRHNAKMKANQASFDAYMANTRSTNNAINNSIMSTYRTQNESSDRGQDQFLNYIRDESNTVDPYSGDPAKVESGAQHYWVNQNGEYIMSNDNFFDPNMDPNSNHIEWRRTETKP